MTEQLEDVIRELDAMEDQDCPAYRRLYDKKYRLEREVKQDWY